jgi:hypothetical protein
LDDHLDELAHHYSRSDNFWKAVEYLGRAGQRALQHSAYSDSINRIAILRKNSVPVVAAFKIGSLNRFQVATTSAPWVRSNGVLTMH